jgi:hypothetical protein
MNAAQMSDLKVMADRKWPAHLRIEQMRQQLAHEEAGCPPPFPGAVLCPNGKDWESPATAARRVENIKRWGL